MVTNELVFKSLMFNVWSVQKNMQKNVLRKKVSFSLQYFTGFFFFDVNILWALISRGDGDLKNRNLV